jgi:hypothetical protein
VQRQAEADRRQAEADQREAAAAAGPAAVSTNPQLAQARAQLHTQWLDVISNQIRDVQGNIEETTKQLASVRDSQQKYNASANPAVASMFVGAYSNMLQNLTRDLVRLQLNESAASAPIYRDGEASEPVRRLSIRRAAAFGIGGGLAVALAIAYALHFFYDGRQLPFARGNVEETHRQLAGPVAPGAESTGRIAAPTRSLRERVAAARGRTLVTELPRESAVS